MNAEDINLKENYGEVFSLDEADEMYRIELVSKTYDFMTQKQIKSLNLAPGARIVDVGAGTGSIASWLSAQPEFMDSEIVAMDRFTKNLEKKLKPAANLKIIRYDITSNDQYFGQFDVVNVRFVLMHLRERAALLSKLASWVKPGGWLMVSDITDLTTECSTNPLYKKTMSAMWDMLIQTIGTDKDWSQSLSAGFKSLGFSNIRKEVYLPPISKGSHMSEFWYLTWKDLHDNLMKAVNLNAETLIQGENSLINGEVTDLSPGMLTCIGQKAG